jgi:uncharacterized membrane protein
MEAEEGGSGFGLGQLIRLLIGALWLYWAQQWISVSGLVPMSVAMAAITAAGSLCIMAAAIMVRGRDQEAHLDRLILVASLAQAALQIVVATSWHGYVSDELAFDQAAASALLHGLNPYGVNLAYALHQYGVSWGTLTLGGQVVHSLAYPSLSFLVYVPATLVFGTGSNAGLGMDALAWVICGLFLWWMLSPALRPCVSLFMLLPLPLLFVAEGATDPLYLPFLLIAVWRWDRFGDPAEATPARWAGPIALGLACCVKQTPWLLVPFLVAGVGIEAHRRGRSWAAASARYALICGAAFLIPNLPFIAWNPGEWLAGALLPLHTALVPLGIGPAELVSAYGLGGGNMGLFELAGDAMMLATLTVFICRYGRLKGLLPLLPLLAVILESRTLASYFLFSIPTLVVAAASVRATSWKMKRGLIASGLTVGGGALTVASAVLVIGALVEPPPLTMTVQSAHVGNSRLVADVTVDNYGSQPVPVHFLLALEGTTEQVMGFSAGPAVLRAGSQATYELTATDQTPLPTPNYPFQIQLTSTDPEMLLATPQLSTNAEGDVSP